MNSQFFKTCWKITEDFPTRDGYYLVAFENSSGGFDLTDCEVWSFELGTWCPKRSFRGKFPSFYVDLPMPKP